MRTWPLALAFVCSLLAAPSARAQQVELAPSWEDGFKEATDRNVPVLVLIGRDGHAPWVDFFQQPAFAKFCWDRVVVLIAHKGGGHQPETKVDPKTKEETKVCPLYPGLTCAQHLAVYEAHAGSWDYKDEPFGVICRPNGTTALEGVACSSVKAMMEKLDEAQTGLGEGVFRSDLTKLEKKLEKGDEKLADGKLKAARGVYEKELKAKGIKSFMTKIVEERLAKLDAKALELIEAAKGLEGKAKVDELHRIAREMKGREPGEVADKALAEAEGGAGGG